MAQWDTSVKHLPSEINKGNRYERKDRVSREQLNAITENSFYATNKSDEALEKANSAFMNNGTIVSVGGVPQLYFDADTKIDITDFEQGINSKSKILIANQFVESINFQSDPQIQIGELQGKITPLETKVEQLSSVPTIIFDTTTSTTGTYNWKADVSTYRFICWSFYNNNTEYSVLTIPVQEWLQLSSSNPLYLNSSSSGDTRYLLVYPNTNAQFVIKTVSKATLVRVWGIK